MKFLIFILTISTALSAQDLENKLIYKDSIQELVMLNSISEENISTLKVCLDLYDCKGFITEKDTSGVTLHQMDVRAIITKLSEFEFEIEYKYRNSNHFIVDTFNIYCLNNSWSIALPLDKVNDDFNSDNMGFWHFIPASTDERDVVYVLKDNEKIIFYLKIK